MRTRPPVLGPGWQPMPTPPRNPQRPIRRQATILGGLTLAALFTGVLARPGGALAVVLAWVVVLFLANHRGNNNLARTVVEYATVAVLAVVLAGSATVPTPTIPQVKADAVQTDQLAQLREGVVNLYEQIAKGFPGPDQEGGR